VSRGGRKCGKGIPSPDPPLLVCLEYVKLCDAWLLLHLAVNSETAHGRLFIINCLSEICCVNIALIFTYLLLGICVVELYIHIGLLKFGSQRLDYTNIRVNCNIFSVCEKIFRPTKYGSRTNVL